MPNFVGLDYALLNANEKFVNNVSTLSFDLARGVDFIHSQKIAHLDLRPSNLLIDDDFHLTIIDFGLAVQLRGENDTITGRRGIPGYMAPELEKGSCNPFRADYYSCGVVFLDMAIFLPPSRRERTLKNFAKLLTNTDPLLRPSLGFWQSEL
ncbi:hypothetical protein GYMLUDRAFT_160293 [Collybiopsis luxurians FD-317 M1]|nr:hypothetical protein GYMLUDRAFT_160293 [Collybiopsis luxurians FD-317 M1]